MNIFTPNHVQLLNACYPPTSALLTSGPGFNPNSQELSKLTYYACVLVQQRWGPGALIGELVQAEPPSQVNEARQ